MSFSNTDWGRSLTAPQVRPGGQPVSPERGSRGVGNRTCRANKHTWVCRIFSRSSEQSPSDQRIAPLPRVRFSLRERITQRDAFCFVLLPQHLPEIQVTPCFTGNGWEQSDAGGSPRPLRGFGDGPDPGQRGRRPPSRPEWPWAVDLGKELL